TQFPRWALNTTVVASISTLVSLTFGTLAGYALARLRFRGASLLGIISFVTYLVPQTLLFIPLNIVITRLPVPLFLVTVVFSTVAVGLPLFMLFVPPEKRVGWGPLASWLPGILLFGIGVSLGLWGLTGKGAALNEIDFGGATNLSNTMWALILTYPTFLVPFCTWLLTGYFQSIPRELEESALIDGASRMQAMLRIVVPLALPGILSAFIFAFTLSWNEYIYALVFLTSTANRTIPVGVVNELIRGDVYFWGGLLDNGQRRLAQQRPRHLVVADQSDVFRHAQPVGMQSGECPGRQPQAAGNQRLWTRVAGQHPPCSGEAIPLREVAHLEHVIGQ